VDECKPLPAPPAAAAKALRQFLTMPYAVLRWITVSPARQGLTFVHVRAQLEQLQDTLMS